MRSQVPKAALSKKLGQGFPVRPVAGDEGHRDFNEVLSSEMPDPLPFDRKSQASGPADVPLDRRAGRRSWEP